METTLQFTDLLRLIDERSTALRAVVGSAPGLDVPVPSCPGWTLFDLVRHLGEGRRKWAAIVAAGPAAAPPDKSLWQGAPQEPEALLAWLAESTEQLRNALLESGPDRGCWTWWDRSVSPQNAGAVARHQVQELAVHTYDAQLSLGDPRPLPDEVALDGVDEFLYTSCAGAYSWPYEPCAVEYHATEGRSWRLTLAADGVRVVAAGENPDASLRGTASDLVLVLYGRLPVESQKVDGDRRLFDLLAAWDPDE